MFHRTNTTTSRAHFPPSLDLNTAVGFVEKEQDKFRGAWDFHGAILHDCGAPRGRSDQLRPYVSQTGPIDRREITASVGTECVIEPKKNVCRLALKPFGNSVDESQRDCSHRGSIPAFPRLQLSATGAARFSNFMTSLRRGKAVCAPTFVVARAAAAFAN